MTWAGVPRLWPRDTVAILGGGPSLTVEQVESCRGRCRVIAVNDSYRLAPWADVLYACDVKWWAWHPDALEFDGPKYMLEHPARSKLADGTEIGVEWLRERGVVALENTGRDGIETTPTGLRTGSNSGIQAINLAAHYGVARILLLGFDMRFDGERSHWHDGHPVRPAESVFRQAMLPCFPPVKAALDELGIECINCTPGSALDVFPRADVADCLLAAA